LTKEQRKHVQSLMPEDRVKTKKLLHLVQDETGWTINHCEKVVDYLLFTMEEPNQENENIIAAVHDGIQGVVEKVKDYVGGKINPENDSQKQMESIAVIPTKNQEKENCNLSYNQPLEILFSINDTKLFSKT